MDTIIGGSNTGQDRRIVILLLLLQATSVIFAKDHETTWSYSDSASDGPKSWYKSYKQCGGETQSPIDLKNFQDTWVPVPFKFHNYEQKLHQARIKNNGHTVYLSAQDSISSISGGCLSSEYKFHQLHFHWGSKDERGSEHTLNGKEYAMEAHFVHIKDKYSTVDEALNDSDGLAVVGIFFKVRDEKNSALEPIVKKVDKIKYSGHSKNITDALTFESLLPDDLSSFYCYRNGSLTTPGCEEIVTWTVFPDAVDIGKDQINTFRNLYFGANKDSAKMVDNYRPIQKLNNRRIYHYNTSAALCSSIILTIFSLLTLKICDIKKMFSS